MINTDLKDVEIAVDKARNDLEEQAEHLKRCLTTKTGLEAIQVELYKHSNDFLEKLAKAKGISLEDLRDSITKYKNKLDTAHLLSIEAKDFVGSEKSNLEQRLSVNLKILALITEVIYECWDLFSLSTRNKFQESALIMFKETTLLGQTIKTAFDVFSSFLQQYIILLYKFDENHEILKIYPQAKVELDKLLKLVKIWSRMEVAVLHYANSIFGAIEWINCQTDLGRSLLKVRQEGIASGETELILSSDDFDEVLTEISGDSVD